MIAEGDEGPHGTVGDRMGHVPGSGEATLNATRMLLAGAIGTEPGTAGRDLGPVTGGGTHDATRCAWVAAYLEGGGSLDEAIGGGGVREALAVALLALDGGWSRFEAVAVAAGEPGWGPSAVMSIVGRHDPGVDLADAVGALVDEDGRTYRATVALLPVGRGGDEERTMASAWAAGASDAALGLGRGQVSRALLALSRRCLDDWGATRELVATERARG